MKASRARRLDSRLRAPLGNRWVRAVPAHPFGNLLFSGLSGFVFVQAIAPSSLGRHFSESEHLMGAAIGLVPERPSA